MLGYVARFCVICSLYYYNYNNSNNCWAAPFALFLFIQQFFSISMEPRAFSVLKLLPVSRNDSSSLQRKNGIEKKNNKDVSQLNWVKAKQNSIDSIRCSIAFAADDAACLPVHPATAVRSICWREKQ